MRDSITTDQLPLVRNHLPMPRRSKARKVFKNTKVVSYALCRPQIYPQQEYSKMRTSKSYINCRQPDCLDYWFSLVVCRYWRQVSSTNKFNSAWRAPYWWNVISQQDLLVTVEPRRPLMNVGTETASRHDQCKHFKKCKHLLRLEVIWCDKTLCIRSFSPASIYMLSVKDFDPKETISEVRVHAELYLDILDTGRSPNAAEFTTFSTSLSFDHHGKTKKEIVKKKRFEK